MYIFCIVTSDVKELDIQYFPSVIVRTLNLAKIKMLSVLNFSHTNSSSFGNESLSRTEATTLPPVLEQ